MKNCVFQNSLKGNKMKMASKFSLKVILLAMVILISGCGQQKVKRVGMVVGLRPEKIEQYKALHAHSNPGVRDLLNKYHIHNFSIFLHQIDGKWYEFGYYEYTGDDFEADMAAMDAEPRTVKWLKVCDPMQLPLKGEKSWAIMEEVYYNK
jgi:L-rhamnose mutarotase